jgi:hypothetical protein
MCPLKLCCCPHNGWGKHRPPSFFSGHVMEMSCSGLSDSINCSWKRHGLCIWNVYALQNYHHWTFISYLSHSFLNFHDCFVFIVRSSPLLLTSEMFWSTWSLDIHLWDLLVNLPFHCWHNKQPPEPSTLNYFLEILFIIVTNLTICQVTGSSSSSKETRNIQFCTKSP